MHGRSEWYIAIPDWKTRLTLLLSQQFYKVSMCKVNLRQVLEQGEGFWEFIRTHKPPPKVLYLERRDKLAQAVSLVVIGSGIYSHPTHTFDPATPEVISLDPRRVAVAYHDLQNAYVKIPKRLVKEGLPVLSLTYEQITGNREVACVPEKVAKKICSFLEVPFALLCSLTRKVHKAPFSEWVSNWDEVLKAVDDVCLRDN